MRRVVFFARSDRLAAMLQIFNVEFSPIADYFLIESTFV